MLSRLKNRLMSYLCLNIVHILMLFHIFNYRVVDYSCCFNSCLVVFYLRIYVQFFFIYIFIFHCEPNPLVQNSKYLSPILSKAQFSALTQRPIRTSLHNPLACLFYPLALLPSSSHNLSHVPSLFLYLHENNSPQPFT